MYKKYLLALIIIIIVAVGFFVQKKTNESLPIAASLRLEGGKQINLRVATTDRERQLGLSYFKSLPQDQGMLFLFDKPGMYPFWMKGMNFPLDIIWLKRQGGDAFQVVFIAKNVLPSTYPQSVYPTGPADAVLELNSGLTTVYNLDLEKNLWISFKK